MRIRYHGHSCFEIQGENGTILIDPFLRGNPQAKVAPEEFTNLDGILVTHGHGDHLGDAVSLSKQTGATIIATYELAWHCERRGAKTHAMHIGGKHKFPFGTVKMVQALHGSCFEGGDEEGMLYAGPACGFLLYVEGKWLYHAGDTGLFGDMELIGQNEIEVAMLPIGDNYVMGPDDAVYAAQLLKPKYVIPMHYNTFPLIEQDPEEFLDLLHRKAPGSVGVALKSGEELQTEGQV